MFSDYEITKATLNSPLIDYNPLQYLIKTRYLLSLRKNEIKRNKLDLDNRLVAEFNSLPTSLIAISICDKMIKKDKNVFDIIKKEITRLDYVTKAYNNKEIKKMPELEMKYLLTGILEQEDMKKILDKLYKDEHKRKDNKIIPFKVKTRVR